MSIAKWIKELFHEFGSILAPGVANVDAVKTGRAIRTWRDISRHGHRDVKDLPP